MFLNVLPKNFKSFWANSTTHSKLIICMVLISYGAPPLFSAALLGQKTVGLSTNDFQNKLF